MMPPSDSNQPPLASSEPLLNVGCGHCYHDAWTNVDLIATGPGVQQVDLRRGLPYQAASFEAVYHSHVLEHLLPEDAARMLRECQRVLRPGGILRVVVPDLEGIAKAYLQALEAASSGDAYAIANHRWMTLELIDQMTRQRSGGRMGGAMRDTQQLNHDFIRARIGGECDDPQRQRPRKTLSQRVQRLLGSMRERIAALTVRCVAGSSAHAAFREGRFRQSGEIHRWMYDRVSLANLLAEVGFEKITVCRAHESGIPDFDSYQLDRTGPRVRKPDSLYMEARKRKVAVARAA